MLTAGPVGGGGGGGGGCDEGGPPDEFSLWSITEVGGDGRGGPTFEGSFVSIATGVTKGEGAGEVGAVGEELETVLSSRSGRPLPLPRPPRRRRAGDCGSG